MYIYCKLLPKIKINQKYLVNLITYAFRNFLNKYQRKEDMLMYTRQKGLFYKSFVYFLTISLIVFLSGFTEIIVEARELNLPLGEMVSRGEVKFKASENVWKKVETSHFPLFPGVNIKTEKGIAAISLANAAKIEVESNSLFYFNQTGQFILIEGGIQFFTPNSSEVTFKVGNLNISNFKAFHVNKDLLADSQKSEGVIGKVRIHSNGSVTVTTVQGNLSILSQDGTVLAALSPKDSVTIPAVTVRGRSSEIVAQVGEPTSVKKGEEFLGISTGAWTWIGIGVGVLGGMGLGYAIGRQHEEKEYIPICP